MERLKGRGGVSVVVGVEGEHPSDSAELDFESLCL